MTLHTFVDQGVEGVEVVRQAVCGGRAGGKPKRTWNGSRNGPEMTAYLLGARASICAGGGPGGGHLAYLGRVQTSNIRPTLLYSTAEVRVEQYWLQVIIKKQSVFASLPCKVLCTLPRAKVEARHQLSRPHGATSLLPGRPHPPHTCTYNVATHTLLSPINGQALFFDGFNLQ